MSDYFDNFTPEAMTALGAEIAAGHQQRRELLNQTRSQTHALLAAARNRRNESENERRKRAAAEADARRLFTSELRSEVHALRNRFELARRDMATDLQHMATELHAAQNAVRAWSGRAPEPAPRRPARNNAKPGVHAAAPHNGNKAAERPSRHEGGNDSPPHSEGKQGHSSPRKRHA